MKLLIVEDEFLVRIGLRSATDWEKHGFVLLEDAIDGEEALDRIEQEQPDIVLLDIRIPKLDGLEVLKEIRRRKYACKVIIVSCHNDFQMVRSAMQLGAVDYLYKLNIKPTELVEVVLRVRGDLVSQPQQEEDGAVSPERALGQNLKGIILGSVQPAAADPHLAAGRSMVIDVDDPGGHFQTVRVDLFIDLIRQVIRSLGVSCCACRVGSGTFYVALGETRPVERLPERLQSQIRSLIGLSVSIGLGPPWHRPEELRTSFEIAKGIFCDRFYDGGGLIREYTAPFAEQGSLTPLITRLEECVARVMKDNRYHEIMGCMREFFSQIRTLRTFSPDVVKVGCIDTFMSVTRQLLPQSLYASGKLEAVMDITVHQTLNKLEQYYQTQLGSIIESIDPARFVSCSPIVESAIAYIKEHINENLALSQIAKAISVSEPYLSTLFHKEVGESCITYINRNKIQLAKTMLAGNSLIYEVAEQLGFENSNYFSKVFKKYVGMSPERFRSEGK